MAVEGYRHCVVEAFLLCHGYKTTEHMLVTQMHSIEMSYRSSSHYVTANAVVFAYF